MTQPPGSRTLTDGLRRLLYVASGLVALAGFQLFVLTDHTAAYFSWTIKPGMSAAFFGAGYLASVFFEFVASRRTVWVDARHTFPPVLTFTVLTEIATLLHLGRFHFGERLIWAGLAAWIWVAIYTLVPLAMLTLLPAQLRVRGVDPPKTAPIPATGSLLLSAQAAVVIPVGALLFFDPVRWSSIWPWTLTPLTGRAAGAWLLGIGVGLVASIAEGDLLRIRPGLFAYAVLGALQLVALARYFGDVDWSRPQAWVYLAVVASVAVVGGMGVTATRSAVRSTLGAGA